MILNTFPTPTPLFTEARILQQHTCGRDATCPQKWITNYSYCKDNYSQLKFQLNDSSLMESSIDSSKLRSDFFNVLRTRRIEGID